MAAWNSTWYSRSPSSSMTCGVGGGVVGVERLERVDQLERLLDQVRRERLVGLLPVPRALLAQRAGQLVEPHVVVADRRAEVRHVDAGEVVGVDRPVELAPGRLDDPFVVGTEALQDRHRLVAGGLLDGQLDVGEHPVGVGVGDQQRPALDRRRRGRSRGRRRAAPPPRPGRCRAGPTRRRGTTAPAARRTSTRPSSTQQPHGALEHERRAGHRVEDLAVLGGRGDEPFDDRRRTRRRSGRPSRRRRRTWSRRATRWALG